MILESESIVDVLHKKLQILIPELEQANSETQVVMEEVKVKKEEAD